MRHTSTREQERSLVPTAPTSPNQGEREVLRGMKFRCENSTVFASLSVTNTLDWIGEFFSSIATTVI